MPLPMSTTSGRNEVEGALADDLDTGSST